MVVKKHTFKRLNKRVNIRTKLQKCFSCKKTRTIITYPCEIDYCSDIKCNNKIPLCQTCSEFELVYVCKDHEDYIERHPTYCDFTGQSYFESPVYYWYASCGIRRVFDTECEGCGKTYKVCGNHENSPIKFSKCAMCLKHTFDDFEFAKRFVYGLRELREDNFTL